MTPGCRLSSSQAAVKIEPGITSHWRIACVLAFCDHGSDGSVVKMREETSVLGGSGPSTACLTCSRKQPVRQDLEIVFNGRLLACSTSTKTPTIGA